MKLTYVTPQMHEEIFQANEYVAACWYIGCAKAGSDDYYESGDITHGAQASGTGCGHAQNQAIRVSDTGVVSMVEVQTDRLGDLPCTITDSKWNPITLNQSDVETGKTIYWTTTSGNRTWHHYGTVGGTGDGANANHS